MAVFYTNSQGAQVGERFGFLVDLNNDGTKMAVSSFGGVRVFDFIEGQWDQVGVLIQDELGASLSNNGNIVATRYRDPVTFSSVLRVFQFDGNNWSKMGNDIVLGTLSFSMSKDGQRIAFVNTNVSNPIASKGSVTIYEYDGAF